MNIQFVCDILGTAAFAVSGAMLAVERRMDIFGVLFLGCVTATGGGFMRDVVLGKIPPNMFRDPVYIVLSLLVSLYVFRRARRSRRLTPHLPEKRFQWILNCTDAVGLGLFTVVGVNMAVEAGYGEYGMFAVFLGLLTGVGGGMLRDILAGLTPSVLVKHVYACASLLGAVLYKLLLRGLPKGLSMFVGAAAVVTIRMLAYHLKWNLPKAGE